MHSKCSFESGMSSVLNGRIPCFLLFTYTPSRLVKEVVLNNDTVAKAWLWLLIFIKIFIEKWYMYIFLWKYFSRQIYSRGFHIFKLNNLKVIHDLYSQCLTQTLSKRLYFFLVRRKYSLRVMLQESRAESVVKRSYKDIKRLLDLF